MFLATQKKKFALLFLASPEPSGTPNEIQIAILSSTSIEVQWQPPDFIDQNGIITGYTVILTNMETGSSHEYSTSGNVTVQHIQGKLLLQYNATKYKLKINYSSHIQKKQSNPNL